MKTEQFIQGSPEWLAHRATHFNASDAPAMMGVSPYKTRAELLRELHTGVTAEVDIATQKRFDEGHRAEALARPLAEEIIGEELYPVTGSSGRLSSSFDGLTLDECMAFEHKALNDELRAAFRAMGPNDDDAACRLLPVHHRVQMEQQLHVSAAERVLFMASAWTADDALIEQRHCWYYPDAELRAAILNGWAQFERDLAAYVPPAAAPLVVAAPVERLPAAVIKTSGALSVLSNLTELIPQAREYVARIPTAPSTDQEFADCDAACKRLKEVEDALDAAVANALASVGDIEAMQRAAADLKNILRPARLTTQKLVAARKEQIRVEAVQGGRDALAAHMAALNRRLDPRINYMPNVVADFAGAIKGRSNIDSLRNAIDTELARAKIAADSAARSIRSNAFAFKTRAAGFEFLFADLAQLVLRPAEDFCVLVDARIDKHKAAELERESKRQAEESRQRIEREAEQQRLAALSCAAAQIPEAIRAVAIEPERSERISVLPVASLAADSAVEQMRREPATMNLGAICARLGFTLTSAFVGDVLGVHPSATDKAAKLYRASDFGRICAALTRHIASVQERQAA